jgi:hypothetical protein
MDTQIKISAKSSGRSRAAKDQVGARSFAPPAAQPARIAQEPHLRLDCVPSIAQGILAVWLGETQAVLVKQGLSKEYCQTVVEGFKTSEIRRDRRDGVPGQEIGATQYGKSGADYSRQAAVVNPELAKIFGGYDNPLAMEMRRLGAAFRDIGVHLRPLTYNGEAAASARLAMWMADMKDARWLLKPHDDMAQVRGYQDWEISRLDRVIAINIYVSAIAGSGQLVLTGWKPTDEDRRERGVEKSGYPYAESEVLHRPHMVMPVETGDIAIIDGSFAHGVLVGEGATNDRLLANFFIGKAGNTAVYWA